MRIHPFRTFTTIYVCDLYIAITHTADKLGIHIEVEEPGPKWWKLKAGIYKGRPYFRRS